MKSDNTIKILVVEDNYADFRFMEHMLGDVSNVLFKKDYILERSEYINSAFQALGNNDYDVVLLDLNLPDENGIESLKRIIKYTGDTPIIVMTGIDDVSLALEAVRYGAQDYIVKGESDPTQLARSIHYAIERRRNLSTSINLALEQRRVHALRQLISEVSHDFRTPLAIIGSSIYLYGKTGQSEHLDHIAQQVNHMSNLLEDFIQLSKLDNDVENVFMQESDVVDFIRNIVKEHKSLAEIKGKSISFSADVNQCHAPFDKKLMYRAILNVVSNAIKYTEANGEIRVQIKCGSNKGYCHIIISDNGIGIPESELSKVFDPFYRVDKSRNSPEGSSGLGLAITKKICDMHNAEIEIQSVVNEGTSVIIKVPLGQI